MANRRKLYKDMEKFRETCKRQRRRYYGKTSFIYEKRAWTADEEKQVLEHKISDHELSSKIRRSVSSIQKKRCFLKKQLGIKH